MMLDGSSRQLVSRLGQAYMNVRGYQLGSAQFSNEHVGDVFTRCIAFKRPSRDAPR